VVICLEQGADLHMSQLMPLPLTVSCFSKIHIVFSFLVPALPGSPGKRPVKWLCVSKCGIVCRGKQRGVSAVCRSVCTRQWHRGARLRQLHTAVYSLCGVSRPIRVPVEADPFRSTAEERRCVRVESEECCACTTAGTGTRLAPSLRTSARARY